MLEIAQVVGECLVVDKSMWEMVCVVRTGSIYRTDTSTVVEVFLSTVYADVVQDICNNL